MTPVWKLRPDQLRAFHAISGKSRVIANMPTGWGKGVLLCSLGAADLCDPKRKVIVCIPQKVIAKGFKREMRIGLPDGRELGWKRPRNLCEPTPDKVAQLLAFIRSPASGSPEDRVVLATHMSLAYAFDALDADEIGAAFRDTTLVIDEAHHVHASDHGRNGLGRAVAALLDRNAPTTKLVLATAYFFRGDHLPILPDAHLTRFTRYHVPFDEYWSGLTHLKTYGYDFVAYKGTVFGELEALLRADAAPTIVYCPPEGHKMLIGKEKRAFVARVQGLCVTHLDAGVWSPRSRPDPRRKVVVDLVDEAHRREKLEFIAGHGDRVAAVLTVGMFKEGADWVEAARVIDLVPTGSDQDRLQRFGRLVRDCPGKGHVSYYSFFPYVVQEGEEERRAELSKLYAHFHASMVLENAINPIKVFVGRAGRAEGDGPGGGGERLDLLGRLSEKTQEAVIRQSFEGLLSLKTGKAKDGAAVRPDEAREVIVGVLRANGVADDLEATATQVVLLMRRKSNVRIATEDLVAAGFDKVWSTDAFDGLVAYSAGVGGPATLAEIRRIIGGVFDRQWAENYEKLRELPEPPATQSSAYWWCAHNRVLHDRGELAADKVRLLERIPWWRWAEAFEDRWQGRYDEISPLPACPRAGTQGYDWVRQQRRLHAGGKLDNYKVRLLEAVPWWTWTTIRDTWGVTCEALQGSVVPPKRGTKEYEWVRTQRKAHADGKLTAERVEKLGTIPWWTWGEGERSRTEGLQRLKSLIEEGFELGTTKAEVRRSWSVAANISPDQIYKYLRLLPPEVRAMWDQMGDARRSARSGVEYAE